MLKKKNKLIDLIFNLCKKKNTSTTTTCDTLSKQVILNINSNDDNNLNKNNIDKNNIDNTSSVNSSNQDFLDINSECTKNEGFEEIDDLIMENNKIIQNIKLYNIYIFDKKKNMYVNMF